METLKVFEGFLRMEYGEEVAGLYTVLRKASSDNGANIGSKP
jgi:hypothetical protein